MSSSLWTFVVIVFFLLLIGIYLFDGLSLWNLSQGNENSQKAITNLQKASDLVDQTNVEIGETIGLVQTELAKIAYDLLPVLKTPEQVCHFCKIEGQQKIDNFVPSSRAVLLAFCEKATQVFGCS